MKFYKKCLNTGMSSCKKCSLHHVDNPVYFDVHTYRHIYKYTQLNIIPHLMSIFGERTNFLRISKLWTLKQTNIVIILSQCLPIAWVIIFFSVSSKRFFSTFPLQFSCYVFWLFWKYREDHFYCSSVLFGIDGKEINFIVHHFVDWHCFYVVTT